MLKNKAILSISGAGKVLLPEWPVILISVFKPIFYKNQEFFLQVP